MSHFRAAKEKSDVEVCGSRSSEPSDTGPSLACTIFRCPPSGRNRHSLHPSACLDARSYLRFSFARDLAV